eukprot:scpid18088/ scgid26951/ Dual specificity mitogen-activated protein kinase kinase 7; JNK-activating kinase 2; MAPK/ERK kinase 7; c-Jun N-terminal kinase kinase 2
MDSKCGRIDLDKTREKLLALSAQVQGLTLNFSPPSPEVPQKPDGLGMGSLSKKSAVPSHRRACSGGSLVDLGINLKRNSFEARSPLSFDSATLHPTAALQRPTSSLSFSNLSEISRTSPTLDFRRPRRSLDRESTRSTSTESLFEGCINEQRQLAKYLTVSGAQYPAELHDLERHGHLGHGVSGLVVRMLHRPSQTMMAVKVMQRNGNDEDQKRVLMDLYVTMHLTDCPHIVTSYGAIIQADEAYICMELMSTCLDKLMKTHKQPFPEPICGKVAVAVVNALNYLKQKHDIIHRDIKPSNILLDATRGVFKICDFGISGHLVNSQACTRDAGCTAYMAPERFMPATASKYDVRADVWSMGVTLVELATAQFPYSNCRSQFEVLTRILDDPSPRLPEDAGFSSLFHLFIDQCLAKDVDQRPRFRDLRNHDFIVYNETANTDVCGWYKALTAT